MGDLPFLKQKQRSGMEGVGTEAGRGEGLGEGEGGGTVAGT